MAETPILHLSLGTDAETNRNWQILDDAMHRLARGVQIPDDLSILGSLDVRDNLTVGGTATVNGGISAAGGYLSTGTDVPTTLHGSLYVEDEGRFAGFPDALRVDSGAIVFPPQSLDGTFLKKAASVQTAAVGTAMISAITLTTTEQQLAIVNLDATEELGRWELVFAQATIRLGIAANESLSISFSLRRGGLVLQARSFTYSAGATPGLSICEFPLSIIRVAIPSNLTHDYSLWGGTVSPTGAPVGRVSFAQVHCLQLR